MHYPHTREGTLLGIEDVHVTLGGRLILKGVSATVENIVRMDVKQGQVIGLVGPSGAGKTTLFRVIGGFLTADSGQVLVRKHGIESDPAYDSLGDRDKLVPVQKGMVGVVTQSYRVFRHLTVLGNLVRAGRKAGLTKAEATDKAKALLDRFGILDIQDRWPMSTQISGGQRQRVAIIQQIMVGHQTICMDEPFSGLDPRQKKNVMKWISELTSIDELLTFIVVTHDIGAAVAVSDHLWLMGKDHDPVSGKALDGARILSIYDLISMGLAWNENIQSMPEFRDLVNQVTERFDHLL